jgi:hypothetical protein
MTARAASAAVILYGTDHPPASIDRFELGPLSFDLEAGKIRYIRFAGIEALRCIAFVVRGPGWESPAPAISDLKSDQSEDGLSIRYRAFYETAGGQLEVAAAIDAPRQGGIVFTAEAHALTDFTTARTSFCILHPIEAVAGKRLDLTRPDESVERVHFPDHISAHQPFMNIRALSHELAGGIRATVRMEGDIWEMEDQRNWTDASFKTYGRPRDLPWPYTIGKGERVVQRAILVFERASPVAATAVPKDIVIGIGNAPSGRLPRVALAVSPEEAPLAMAAAPALNAHELIAWYEHGVQDLVALKVYAALGRRLNAPVGLELVLPCKAPVEREMADVAALLRQADLKPSSLLAIQAPMTRWVLKRPEELGLPGFAEVYAAARRCFPGVALGAGVTSNFTEFNIDRPDLEGVDYVTHSTAAVIHEPDDRSVMETLETLPHIFRSMRQIAGRLPYRLGPSAIGMRYNPYGKTTEANPANVRIAFARQDPRQRGLFGAAFALGYFCRAVEAGIDSVCLGAPTGPFGLIYRRTEYSQPWFDAQSEPAVYPLFHPIMALAKANGAPSFPVKSSDPKRVLGLAYEHGKQKRLLWLANLTAHPQAVRVPGELAGSTTVRQLDSASAAAAALDPAGFAAGGRPIAGSVLTLAPYAVAALDGAF